MRVGLSVFAQNYPDWERYESRAFVEAPTWPDSAVYDDAIRLGSLAEPLGFDSIWAVEHHFTPYTMIPDVLQLLTFFAGRTQRVDLGTMVVVLPWHNPLQTAEQISVLDNLLQGRRLTVGMGRGAGRVEFEGLNLEMAESRERFSEALEVIRKALGQPSFHHEGKYYRYPKDQSIRPRPRSADLLDRMCMAWGSPASGPIAARLGLQPLFIPQKPWADCAAEMSVFNGTRMDMGLEPTRPVVVCWAFCAETAREAEEAVTKYLVQYSDSARRHYELDDAEHFHNTPGYEHYADHAEQTRSVMSNPLEDMYVKSQVWGTPEMCLEKLRGINDVLGAEEFVAVFQYGAMPFEVAERSLRLFAREVLPELKTWKNSTPPVPASA
jgi:alkanesulfonate monooxygenase SsuD/methylene tetrahydromethanopterin reductase-like flavin-dependent oxidoreductase (luciferase family)